VGGGGGGGGGGWIRSGATSCSQKAFHMEGTSPEAGRHRRLCQNYGLAAGYEPRPWVVEPVARPAHGLAAVSLISGTFGQAFELRAFLSAMRPIGEGAA